MFTTLMALLGILGAYLMGSVCSAVIVSQLFNLPDPRLEGSKNPGATNILRLAGPKYAALVLVCDMLKGTLPVCFASYFTSSTPILALTCLAAVLGHIYPVFFNFKGGKGVATALGALIGFHPVAGIAVLLTWIMIAYFSRYSSLASMLAIILAPFYCMVDITTIAAFLPIFFITAIILFQHKNNIMRLFNGEEPKISI